MWSRWTGIDGWERFCTLVAVTFDLVFHGVRCIATLVENLESEFQESEVARAHIRFRSRQSEFAIISSLSILLNVDAAAKVSTINKLRHSRLSTFPSNINFSPFVREQHFVI